MDINSENNTDAHDTSNDDVHRGSHERVRKRIRVKKKKSPKRKLRKLGEKVVWTLIILAFVATLIYLLSEIDMSDKRYKKKTLNEPFYDYPTYG